MLIGRSAAWQIETARRARAPHGTGDLLSGLFLAHLLRGEAGPEALALSLGAVEAVLDQSQGSDALDLARGLARPPTRLDVLALEAGA
jgi:pyridoxal/pyridoxine/pyridoxamine kinase